VRSNAQTVDEYLAALPDDRATALREVREVILANLPPGYRESMTWGMPTYEVPLERYPDTYNGKPLMYAGLAAQKNHLAVYLTALYLDRDDEDWFRDRYAETGKRLDMGKSCLRFKRLEDLPLEVVGEAIARTSVDDYIANYERSRAR